jgi:hypothetical protein
VTSDLGAITHPGTINDLVADAAGVGYQVTPRLIRDWSEVGLLDYPRHRPAGRGHGSRHALYPATQRKLFLTLLDKRKEATSIRSLARSPVWFWLYFGDSYIPLRQARRAFMTWLGDPRVSLRVARATAREILGRYDNPDATQVARTELVEVLTRGAYEGHLDGERLSHAVREVFEPGYGQVRRAVGPAAAPITSDTLLTLIRARLVATERLNADKVSDEEFGQARQAHLLHDMDYAVRQPQLAADAPEHLRNFYQPVTWESRLNGCCSHLWTVIGLQIMFPQAPVLAPGAPPLLTVPMR